MFIAHDANFSRHGRLFRFAPRHPVLPNWSAYATTVAAALGGLLLVLGIQTRWVALALAPILAGAIWVHSGNGWLFASTDGG